MVETQVKEQEPTLPSLLAARARSASDARLALDTGVGLLGASLALAARPTGWPLIVAVATCFFAYGVWGIADRGLVERTASARGTQLLRSLRFAAAMLGITSTLAVAGIVMGLVLGNWIH